MCFIKEYSKVAAPLTKLTSTKVPFSWSEQAEYLDKWAVHLLWVVYAHNSLTTSATNKSPFEVAPGYQPPLFPDQEMESGVPTVQAHLLACHIIWREAREGFLCASGVNKRLADHHQTPAPVHSPGPSYIGPFTINKIISPSTVWLELP